MSESVTLKSYFYEVLIPSSQKNTSSPIEDILHHVSISFMKKLALYKCFNPRTHTGCDFIRSVKHLIVRVSIHAPTRGATCVKSIFPYIWSMFQSTHPHGVRRFIQLSYTISSPKVSIHAPTRGATSTRDRRFIKRMFQSTHPHGVRQQENGLILFKACFNPRTHTGCDLWLG